MEKYIYIYRLLLWQYKSQHLPENHPNVGTYTIHRAYGYVLNLAELNWSKLNRGTFRVYRIYKQISDKACLSQSLCLRFFCTAVTLPLWRRAKVAAGQRLLQYPLFKKFLLLSVHDFLTLSNEGCGFQSYFPQRCLMEGMFALMHSDGLVEHRWAA